MYRDLTQTLYKGEMEPKDHYIAIGDLVYTFLHSRHLGHETNPLGRYLFTKSISEDLTRIYHEYKEQDNEEEEEKEKEKDEFSFSSTTLGRSPASDSTHTEYTPSDTVSECTPSPKAKDPPKRKKSKKGTTTTIVTESAKPLSFASSRNDDDVPPKKKPFEFAENSPKPFTAITAEKTQTDPSPNPFKTWSNVQKQQPDQPDQPKERFRSLFSWGGFGSSKQTSPDQQPPTEVEFASPSTQPSLFKKTLPKPTYGEHIGEPDKRWSDEESAAEDDDNLTLGEDDSKTEEESFTKETSKQKGDNTEEDYGNDFAKAFFAEITAYIQKP